MSLRLILIACACSLAPSLALAEQPVAAPAPDEVKVPPDLEPPPAPEPEVVKPDGAPVSAGGINTSFDETEVRSLAGSESIGMDSRSYAKDWLVAPRGYNIGGELRFITAATSPDGPRIKFTDLAILRLQTRWTASRRIELSGSVDLLAKQPDSRKDIFIQGGGLGIKIATSRANAIAAGVSGGPTMGDDGFWGSVGTGVIHRSRIEEFLAFQYGGGASATGLRMNDGDPQWQAGLAASSELVFHTPRGEWATWLGFDLELPVVHSDALDPRSRLGVTVGMVFAAVKDWDIYTVFTWRDRGTTELPATTLPIIDGGFDQKQFAVGLTRRFSVRGKSAKWALAL